MPRVKLGTPTPAQQRAVMNKIIKKAMVSSVWRICRMCQAAISGMHP